MERLPPTADHDGKKGESLQQESVGATRVEDDRVQQTLRSVPDIGELCALVRMDLSRKADRDLTRLIDYMESAADNPESLKRRNIARALQWSPTFLDKIKKRLVRRVRQRGAYDVVALQDL